MGGLGGEVRGGLRRRHGNFENEIRSQIEEQFGLFLMRR